MNYKKLLVGKIIPNLILLKHYTFRFFGSSKYRQIKKGILCEQYADFPHNGYNFVLTSLHLKNLYSKNVELL